MTAEATAIVVRKYVLASVASLLVACGIGHEDRPFCSGELERWEYLAGAGTSSLAEIRIAVTGGPSRIESGSSYFAVGTQDESNISETRLLDADQAPLPSTSLSMPDDRSFEETLEDEPIPYAIIRHLEVTHGATVEPTTPIEVFADLSYCHDRGEGSVEVEFRFCEGSCD